MCRAAKIEAEQPSTAPEQAITSGWPRPVRHLEHQLRPAVPAAERNTELQAGLHLTPGDFASREPEIRPRPFELLARRRFHRW